MKKLIVAATVVLASMHAHAWGDREQGILAGIAGTVILQHIYEANKERQAEAAPEPQRRPVYRDRHVHEYPQAPVVISRPAPVYTDRPLNCVSRPVLWDQYTGRPIRYETHCQ